MPSVWYCLESLVLFRRFFLPFLVIRISDDTLDSNCCKLEFIFIRFVNIFIFILCYIYLYLLYLIYLLIYLWVTGLISQKMHKGVFWMELTFFTLTICLIIPIHQIYKFLYFYRDMESCCIYRRSKILFGKLFLLSLSMSWRLDVSFLTSSFASMAFSI